MEHYKLAREVTPEESLLDFKLEDGWGPLCVFLRKDIPVVPFPWANETGAFKEKQGHHDEAGRQEDFA